MNTFLKRLASTISVVGLSLGLALPALAQSNLTPGPANNPDQPGAPPTDRDTGVPPIGGESDSQNTPSQSVPGVVNPANRPVSPGQPAASSPASGSKTLDQVVRTSPSFELFNALLRVADSEGILGDELNGSEDYTVFAPTDQALAALPPGTFKALVQPENRDLLARVLENHIVEGKVSSSDLVSRQVRARGGNPLAAQGGEGTILVGNARVIGPDIQASNGIIHAVDQVIIPADLQSRLGGLAQPAAPGMGRQ